MDAILTLIIYMMLPFIPVGLILLMDVWGLKKCVILYFETEKLIRMKTVSVKDGMVKMGKRRFYVDKSRPAMIPMGILIKPLRPLYVFKWDRSIAMDVSSAGLKSEGSPENLTNLLQNKTLDQLLTPKGSSKQVLLFMIMGLVMGGLAGFILAKSF
jgi:hypothetical protein